MYARGVWRWMPAGVFAVALALGLIRLGAQPLSFDEQFTRDTATLLVVRHLGRRTRHRGPAPRLLRAHEAVARGLRRVRLGAAAAVRPLRRAGGRRDRDPRQKALRRARGPRRRTRPGHELVFRLLVAGRARLHARGAAGDGRDVRVRPRLRAALDGVVGDLGGVPSRQQAGSTSSRSPSWPRTSSRSSSSHRGRRFARP